MGCVKNAIKYIVSIFTATVLLATPVLGAPVSGSQLLERFDRIHVLPLLAEFQAAPSAHEELSFFDDESNLAEEDLVIVIIEEEQGYGDEEADEDYPAEPNVDTSMYTENIPSNVRNVPGFSVVSGINRQSESTFDTSRTIVGTAPRGTLIRIEVFGYREATDSFYKVSGSVLTVGASGNFSSVQQLSLGHNFIRIQAIYNDVRSETAYISVESAQINRIPNEVRNQLERGLLLP